MIFGEKGKNLFKLGNIDFFSDGTSQLHTKNAIFNKNRSVSFKSENILFTPKGTILKNGSSFIAPDGTWFHSGSILYSPKGKSFFNVNSEDEALSIINHENS